MGGGGIHFLVIIAGGVGIWLHGEWLRRFSLPLLLTLIQNLVPFEGRGQMPSSSSASLFFTGFLGFRLGFIGFGCRMSGLGLIRI